MIVSIYLKTHEYLNDKPQTINFGGEYLYSFKEVGNELLIYRKLNEKFIPGFFNIAESNCKISLLSAIVGENGVGKSSFLNIIRTVFADHIYAFPDNICVILAEFEGETKILFQSSEYSSIYIKEFDRHIQDKRHYFKQIKIAAIPKETTDKTNYQSLYYSPHIDLKYSKNFDEFDKFDISLDKYIQSDLDGIAERNTNEQGFKYSLHNELKFKNALRVIDFMASEVFQNSEILKVFNLKAKYDEIDLIFRGLEEDKEFWNTPSQFRAPINKIKELAEKEIGNWTDIRIFNNNDRVENQAEINKYILQRHIIISILSIIKRMLEQDAGNSYLNEGEIDESEFDAKNQNAEALFLSFIRTAFVSKGQRKKVFDEDLFFDFFKEVNSAITAITDEGDVTNQRISIRLEKVRSILELHSKIVKNLMSYFERDSDKNLNLYEFISVDPYRNMSSGELALLNFFSRLYSFVQHKQERLNRKNIILLLDEADLGFHPIWKKKFVKAILKALPHFFESQTVYPNLQIILTTHDPLTLSDLPINNVVFLHKVDDKLEVVTEKEKIQRTFGANITDLLAHSFFIENGLIGDFAKSKIDEVINWINIQKDRPKREINLNELEKYKKVISLIDEKVLKLKLTEMITDLYPDDVFFNKMVDDEILKLINLRKNDTNRYK